MFSKNNRLKSKLSESQKGVHGVSLIVLIVSLFNSLLKLH